MGITDSVSIRNAFASCHSCATPVYCIEVVPGSYLPVFDRCLRGECCCVFVLQGAVTELRLCQFVSALVKFDSITERDWYVVTGVCRGFRIVDKNCPTAYYCENYASVTKGALYDEMSGKIESELSTGKVRQVSHKPKFVHSLGLYDLLPTARPRRI